MPVLQMCTAATSNTHANTDKMPNKYESVDKQVDLTSTAMIPISTVKRKKEKYQESLEDNC